MEYGTGVYRSTPDLVEINEEFSTGGKRNDSGEEFSLIQTPAEKLCSGSNVKQPLALILADEVNRRYDRPYNNYDTPQHQGADPAGQSAAQSPSGECPHCHNQSN